MSAVNANNQFTVERVVVGPASKRGPAPKYPYSVPIVFIGPASKQARAQINASPASVIEGPTSKVILIMSALPKGQ